MTAKTAWIALAIWTAFALLLAAFFRGSGEPEKVGWVLAMWVLGLPVGIVLFGVVGSMVRDVRTGPPTGRQLICTNCGAPLFRQWWNKSKGVYECRVCGHDTAGRMSDGSSPP